VQDINVQPSTIHEQSCIRRGKFLDRSVMRIAQFSVKNDEDARAWSDADVVEVGCDKFLSIVQRRPKGKQVEFMTLRRGALLKDYMMQLLGDSGSWKLVLD
jgi:hypothetical protein